MSSSFYIEKVFNEIEDRRNVVSEFKRFIS